jgi:hypothetical protein
MARSVAAPEPPRQRRPLEEKPRLPGANRWLVSSPSRHLLAGGRAVDVVAKSPPRSARKPSPWGGRRVDVRPITAPSATERRADSRLSARAAGLGGVLGLGTGRPRTAGDGIGWSPSLESFAGLRHSFGDKQVGVAPAPPAVRHMPRTPRTAPMSARARQGSSDATTIRWHSGHIKVAPFTVAPWNGTDALVEEGMSVATVGGSGPRPVARGASPEHMAVHRRDMERHHSFITATATTAVLRGVLDGGHQSTVAQQQRQQQQPPTPRITHGQLLHRRQTEAVPAQVHPADTALLNLRHRHVPSPAAPQAETRADGEGTGGSFLVEHHALPARGTVSARNHRMALLKKQKQEAFARRRKRLLDSE